MPVSKPEFVSVRFSPWSLKPKWALKCSQLDITFTEKPLVEFPLKWRLGIKDDDEGSDGKLTWPIMALPDGTVLRQGLDIAKWCHTKAAEGTGIGGADSAKWNPKIDEWDTKGTLLMRLGRSESFKVAVVDDAKCVEMIKLLKLPIPTDTLKLKVGRKVAIDVGQKYAEEAASTSFEKASSIMDEMLTTLQDSPSWKNFEATGTLDKDGPYLLDSRFSYADIAMVMGMHTLRLYTEELPTGMLTAIAASSTIELMQKHETVYKWGKAVLKAHLPELSAKTSRRSACC